VVRSTQARLTAALVHDDSSKIDGLVRATFASHRREDPWLALACIARLLLRGEEELVRGCCDELLRDDATPEHARRRAQQVLDGVR